MMIRILIIAFIVGLAGPAASAQTDNHTSVRVQSGAGIPVQEYVNIHLVSGLGITVPLRQRLALSLDLGYWTSPVDEVLKKFYEGQLKAFPLTASLRFIFSHQKRANPYVFAGAGYVFCSFETGGIITIPEITIDQSVKNSLCLQAGLGIDFPISRSAGFFAETGYFHRKTTGITTIVDLNSGTTTEEFSANLSSWTFQVGFRHILE